MVDDLAGITRFRDLAAQCRRLSRTVNEAAQANPLEMAEDYEAQAQILEGRMLRLDGTSGGSH
jgi:hypothetical protein